MEARSERVYCPRCEDETLHTAGQVRPERLRCFVCGLVEGQAVTAPAPASVYQTEVTGWAEAPLWSETRWDERVVVDVRPAVPDTPPRERPMQRPPSKAERRRARRAGRLVVRPLATGGTQ